MRVASCILVACLGACVADVASPADDAEGHDEPADFAPLTTEGTAGEAQAFDPNFVVRDERYVNDGSFTADEIQAFFENTPYGNRSWLAGYRIDGRALGYDTDDKILASRAIFDVANAHGIHPLMLVVRMQVEMTLVSKEIIPPQERLDAAFGCGCHDGRRCSSDKAGFANQLTCSAQTHRDLYDAAVGERGSWRVGVATKTVDGVMVTPKNHATAALYQYTPNVLVNRGGNWLVWNVARKYEAHAVANGYFGG